MSNTIYWYFSSYSLPKKTQIKIASRDPSLANSFAKCLHRETQANGLVIKV